MEVTVRFPLSPLMAILSLRTMRKEKTKIKFESHVVASGCHVQAKIEFLRVLGAHHPPWDSL